MRALPAPLSSAMELVYTMYVLLTVVARFAVDLRVLMSTSGSGRVTRVSEVIAEASSSVRVIVALKASCIVTASDWKFWMGSSNSKIIVFESRSRSKCTT